MIPAEASRTCARNGAKSAAGGDFIHFVRHYIGDENIPGAIGRQPAGSRQRTSAGWDGVNDSRYVHLTDSKATVGQLRKEVNVALRIAGNLAKPLAIRCYLRSSRGTFVTRIT